MTQVKEHLLWTLLGCGSLLCATVSGLLHAEALGLKATPLRNGVFLFSVSSGHSSGINKTRQLF